MIDGNDDACPFKFNFDPSMFEVGDVVSYKIPEAFGDMPFVGELLEVGPDFVVINPNDPNDPDRQMLGSRESRPVVAPSEALD